MTGKSPGFWFFTGDWLKDSELRFCSLFARGLLVDLLCILFEAKERGYASKPDGTPRTDTEIVSAVSGGSIEEKLAALAELEASGVLSRDDRGVLYSRRLARLGELSQKRSKAGSKGGSKHASKTEANEKQNNKQNKGVSDSDSVSVSTNTPIVPKGTEDGFEQFWNAVHRREARSKAESAFAKAVTVVASRGMSRAEAATWIAGRMRAFAKSPQAADDVKGKLHPATWLNQGRYDDDDSLWNGDGLPSRPRVATAEDLASWSPQGSYE